MNRHRIKRKRTGASTGARPRAWIQTLVLLLGTTLILAGELGFYLCSSFIWEEQTLEHVTTGRVLMAGLFYLAYLAVLVRILLASRGSLTRALIWVPTLAVVIMVGAMILSMVVAFGKEAYHLLGSGTNSWVEIDATLDGALTLFPAIALITVFTPIFIPFDLLKILPKLMLFDVQAGVGALNHRTASSKEVRKKGGRPRILLVEDDIDGATQTINFFNDLGLRCHHVSTVMAADRYLRFHLATIKVVFLHDLMSVDSTQDRRTGVEWLAQLGVQYPVDSRTFKVIMISGHRECQEDLLSQADLVLPRNWDVAVLTDFLKENDLLRKWGTREGVASPPEPTTGLS